MTSFEYRLSKPKVEHIKWSDSYSMGIRIIDEQHKWFLDFVNDLHNHIAGHEKEERVYLASAIQQAVDFIKFHFSIEEKYMKAIKYPGYAEHKKHHDDFTLTVIKTAKDFKAGKRLVLITFSKFLRDWILSHIAVVDKRYSDYLKQIAARKKVQ